MTTHYPPIETGLSGDRYVEEDLELFVDDLSDAQRPGVYALKLSIPASWDYITETWRQQYDVESPEWLREAFESRGALYIGAAKNVASRVHQHLDHPNKSSAITRVFPIHSIWDIWWYPSAGEAFDHEHEKAFAVRNQFDGVYVHAR